MSVDAARTAMLLAQAEKFRLETATRELELVRAEAEARTAGLLADQAALATDRLTMERKLELHADIHHGVFRLTGEVTDETVSSLIAALTGWRRLYPAEDECRLIITSPGGAIVDGIALFDHLRALAGDGVRLVTVVSGLAASMAAVIAQAGTERVVMPTASYMLHQASFSMSGKSFEVRDRAKWVELLEERFLDIVSSRSGMDRDELRRFWDRTDWWVLGPEAVDLGLFDRLGTFDDLA